MKKMFLITLQPANLSMLTTTEDMMTVNLQETGVIQHQLLTDLTIITAVLSNII